MEKPLRMDSFLSLSTLYRLPFRLPRRPSACRLILLPSSSVARPSCFLLPPSSFLPCPSSLRLLSFLSPYRREAVSRGRRCRPAEHPPPHALQDPHARCVVEQRVRDRR